MDRTRCNNDIKRWSLYSASPWPPWNEELLPLGPVSHHRLSALYWGVQQRVWELQHQNMPSTAPYWEIFTTLWRCFRDSVPHTYTYTFTSLATWHPVIIIHSNSLFTQPTSRPPTIPVETVTFTVPRDCRPRLQGDLYGFRAQFKYTLCPDIPLTYACLSFHLDITALTIWCENRQLLKRLSGMECRLWVCGLMVWCQGYWDETIE